MLPVFGAESAGAGYTITADMFKGLTSAVSSNAEILIPIGITVMGIMVGISLIPRILYKCI